MSNVFIKDPNSTLNFSVDWSEWLDGDTISASTWVVPDGITQEDASNTDSAATIVLSGGTLSRDYPIVNRVTTAGGLINDQTLIIKVRSR